MLRPIAGGLIALLSSISCAPAAETAPPPGPPAPPGPIPHPTGATDLLVGYAAGGGYSGFGFGWTGLPVIALFGDGRLIFATSRSNPTSYQMQETRVSSAQIQEILGRARALGLLAGSTRQHGSVADADSAVLTVRTAERCVTHDEYPAPVEGAVASLVDAIRQLVARSELSSTVVPLRYESVGLLYNWTAPSPDCARAATWPIETPPADAPFNQRVCKVLDRQAASALAPAMPALDRSVAAIGDRCVAYSYRPLLPGEENCPGRFPASCPQ